MTNQRFQVGRIGARRVIWGVIGAFLMINAATAATTYTYDALGRVIMVVYDNGSTVTYSYDAAGNRTTVATTTGSSTIWGAFTWGAANWQP